MRIDNSLDLISDINKLIAKLNKSSQKGGAIRKLKKYKSKKLSFLKAGEKKQLHAILESLTVVGGKNKQFNKLSYNSLDTKSPKSKTTSKEKNTKSTDVDQYGNLSDSLEYIIGGSKKYTQSDDIKAILDMANRADLIDTTYINDMVGGKPKLNASKALGGLKAAGDLVGSAVSANPDALEALGGLKAAGDLVGSVGSAVSANPDASKALGGLKAAGDLVGSVGSAVSANPDASKALGGLKAAGDLVGSAVSANPDALKALGGLKAAGDLVGSTASILEDSDGSDNSSDSDDSSDSDSEVVEEDSVVPQASPLILNCEVINELLSAPLTPSDTAFVDMLDSLQTSLEQRVNAQSPLVKLSSDQKIVFGNSLAAELFTNYSKLDKALDSMLTLETDLQLNPMQKIHIMGLFADRIHSILNFLDPE